MRLKPLIIAVAGLGLAACDEPVAEIKTFRMQATGLATCSEPTPDPQLIAVCKDARGE